MKKEKQIPLICSTCGHNLKYSAPGYIKHPGDTCVWCKRGVYQIIAKEGGGK